ncbi:hypothetical protein GMO_24240 [Gluconobacter morbifer G707]|uniref:Uncharacterized protein n=1 Tax=Gluconobacter morbifer G707 TaxID=1088869 RepID=G6XM24_9PROT|nr:hypothetical protein GMO_24240 [Gluconobacter morbifer G707]
MGWWDEGPDPAVIQGENFPPDRRGETLIRVGAYYRLRKSEQSGLILSHFLLCSVTFG